MQARWFELETTCHDHLFLLAKCLATFGYRGRITFGGTWKRSFRRTKKKIPSFPTCYHSSSSVDWNTDQESQNFNSRQFHRVCGRVRSGSRHYQRQTFRRYLDSLSGNCKRLNLHPIELFLPSSGAHKEWSECKRNNVMGGAEGPV